MVSSLCPVPLLSPFLLLPFCLVALNL
ncbi:unnamed protein product, partial [Vitis vinifera]